MSLQFPANGFAGSVKVTMKSSTSDAACLSQSTFLKKGLLILVVLLTESARSSFDKRRLFLIAMI